MIDAEELRKIESLLEENKRLRQEIERLNGFASDKIEEIVYRAITGHDVMREGDD